MTTTTAQKNERIINPNAYPRPEQGPTDANMAVGFIRDPWALSNVVIKNVDTFITERSWFRHMLEFLIMCTIAAIVLGTIIKVRSTWRPQVKKEKHH